MTVHTSLAIDIFDPINARILAVSEDKIQGFLADPLAQIAALTSLDLATVADRIVAMLEAGTIRRVRQTLMSINLAHGALVAWNIPAEYLNYAFDFMFQKDPFSGHIVVRSTDKQTVGSQYRLWTTLKIPDGFSMAKHCQLLLKIIAAEAAAPERASHAPGSFKLMPANKIFALGVGHVRRRGLPPGSLAEAPAVAHDTQYVQLSPLDWQVLTSLKREFAPQEILAAVVRPPAEFWSDRASEAGVTLEQFLKVANSLHDRKVIGRFSTFLEHVKPNAAGQRVTTYNALFHWAVPQGREIDAGNQVGRFHIMTHAYWREGGPEFNNVNIMGVVHGTDKDTVLAHKAAIDSHLLSPAGGSIPLNYTNVFWGGRSEIKPSEISPLAYLAWLHKMNVDPETMRTKNDQPMP